MTTTKLEGRLIRVDWDIGFSEGRQYGRGKGGIQWRDCFRQKEDPERPKPMIKPMNFNQNNTSNGGFKKQKRENYVNIIFLFFSFKLNYWGFVNKLFSFFFRKKEILEEMKIEMNTVAMTLITEGRTKKKKRLKSFYLSK